MKKKMYFLVVLMILHSSFLECEEPPKNLTNSIGMTFVYVPPGTFDITKHYKITLTHGFYIQTTEVTQGQWKAVMPHNPSYFKECGDTCPVDSVSWMDTQRFIRKLNQHEGGTPKYRLPTSAEWSYACKAGEKGQYAFGDKEVVKDDRWYIDYEMIKAYAWYDENSEDTTHPVGLKKPNAWGLYDVHGNVSEWCLDFEWSRDKDKEQRKHFIDPVGPISGYFKFYHGGSHGSRILPADSEYFKYVVFEKIISKLDFGFRIVMSKL